MKGAFIVNPTEIEEFNREEWFSESPEALTRILRALPLESRLDKDLSEGESITFKVSPEGSEEVRGVNLPVYDITPSEEVGMYNNKGGPVIEFVDSSQNYVTMAFSGKLFTFNYQP